MSDLDSCNNATSLHAVPDNIDPSPFTVAAAAITTASNDGSFSSAATSIASSTNRSQSATPVAYEHTVYSASDIVLYKPTKILNAVPVEYNSFISPLIVALLFVVPSIVSPIRIAALVIMLTAGDAVLKPVASPLRSVCVPPRGAPF